MKNTMKKKLEASSGEIEQVSDSSDDELEANAEDAGNALEIAWEVLEYARIIYSKMPSRTLDLAEVHLQLGDLSMESDNMEQVGIIAIVIQ